ncbi:MAG: hypothetical protein ACRYG4_23380, partial [Janthinobacterium lividum]
MSAEPGNGSGAGTWRVRLACSRAEAEAVQWSDVFADDDAPPTLLTDEPDPSCPDDWVLDAYFAGYPDEDA